MTCKECNLYYEDDNPYSPFGSEVPYCHADPDQHWLAPCEQEDEYEPSDWMDETGFDPYEGCYTYDC